MDVTWWLLREHNNNNKLLPLIFSRSFIRFSFSFLPRSTVLSLSRRFYRSFERAACGMLLSPAHLFFVCSTFGHFSHEQIHFDCSHTKSDKLNMNVSALFICFFFFFFAFAADERRRKNKSITNSTTSRDCLRHTIGKCKKPFIIHSIFTSTERKSREFVPVAVPGRIVYFVFLPLTFFTRFSCSWNRLCNGVDFIDLDNVSFQSYWLPRNTHSESNHAAYQIKSIGREWFHRQSRKKIKQNAVNDTNSIKYFEKRKECETMHSHYAT